MRTRQPATLLELLAALTRIDLHFPCGNGSRRERRAAARSVLLQCTLIMNFAEARLENIGETDELALTLLDLRKLAMELRLAAIRASANPRSLDKTRTAYDTLRSLITHVALLDDPDLAGKVDAAMCS